MELTRSADRSIVNLQIAGGPLTTAAARWLSGTCESLVEDRDVRIVVLAASDDFCTGPHPDLELPGDSVDPASAISRLRVPTIAVVAGRCVSVGVEIALACDVRVASVDASFSVPDLSQGRLPSWGGTQRLPRAVGHARATQLLFTGQEIDAHTACEWGLVHEVTDDPAPSIAALTEQLLGTGPLALEFAKEAVHRGAELSLRDGLRLEGDLNHQLAATDDRAEGLAAFFEKRPPDFSGR